MIVLDDMQQWLRSLVKSPESLTGYQPFLATQFRVDITIFSQILFEGNAATESCARRG